VLKQCGIVNDANRARLVGLLAGSALVWNFRDRDHVWALVYRDCITRESTTVRRIHFHWPFSLRRLRWKLTASYTLVTVATLVVIELLLLCAGLIALRNVVDELPERITDQMAGDIAPQLRPYLEDDPPDLRGLHQWLQDIDESGFRRTDRVPGLTFTINAFDIEGGRDYLVVDADGHVLGQLDQPVPPAAPQSVQPIPPIAPPPDPLAEIEDLDVVLPRALAGEGNRDRLRVQSPSGHLTVAVPIRAENGAVLGALVYSSPFSTMAVLLGGGALFVLASAVLFTLIAGLIGTTFGLLTARGFVKRLNRYTTVASAWGAGNFSQNIQDRSRDEIGKLGQQLNRMADQLEELIQTRQELSAVDERNRLARDLHDSVKQQMFATSMNLATARALWEQDPVAARQRLETAIDLVHQSQQEMTTIIQTLRPVQLEGKGLREALATYVERWQDQTGIASTFEARGDGSLPLPVEEALFRMAQEALANAARHGRAATAQVMLTTESGQVALTIRDDGRGFDTRASSQGLGLRSMRERVESVGGDLRIESGEGGTLVVARVPVPRAGQP
jgi:two-component system, NarL family, sensor histidine kinase LiaS